MGTPIPVIIVENDPEVRKLTSSLINYMEGIECVGSFADAESFTASLASLSVDVVLMDIGLPGQSGSECVRNLHSKYPQIEFVMFTQHSDSRDVFEALKAGASGYVLKTDSPEQLAQSIRIVKEGGSPMSASIARMVVRSFEETEPAYPRLEKLSPAENHVLALLGKGLSYKDIAEIRHVSEHTVRSQARSIYRKLEVHSRMAALNKKDAK